MNSFAIIFGILPNLLWHRLLPPIRADLFFQAVGDQLSDGRFEAVEYFVMPRHSLGLAADMLRKLWIEFFILIFVQSGLTERDAKLLFRLLNRRFD